MSSAYICDYCQKPFSTKSNLKTHTLTARYCLQLQDSAKLTSDSINCEFCHFVFTHEKSLSRHLKTCNKKPVIIDQSSIIDDKNKVIKKQKVKLLKLNADVVMCNTKIEALEMGIKNCNKIVTERDLVIKNQDVRIVELEKSLAYEKGQSDALKSKSTTTIVNKNCNMSSKLSNIQITTIKPFTIEHIAELVPNYTRAHFLRKHQGLVDIIVPFVTLEVDGVTERNIVCTDMSRTICHLLAEDRSWSSDNGLTICSKIVELFIPKMTEFMKVINDTFHEARKIMDLESDKFTKSKRHADAKKIFDEYFLILEDMNPFYRAVYNKREEYDTLLRVFRDLIKPAIHIRSNRVTEV